VILRSRERSQIPYEQRDILERRLLVFLEPEAQPAGGEAAVAIGLLTPDQGRELERLGDRDAADLPRGHLCDHEVSALERSLKDRSRMPLGRQLRLSRGRTRHRV
jgi:hypothetical protein